MAILFGTAIAVSQGRSRVSLVNSPKRLGAAHALSPDARCGHPDLRSLGDVYAPPSMAALAVYAVSRGWAAPRRVQHSTAQQRTPRAIEAVAAPARATFVF